MSYFSSSFLNYGLIDVRGDQKDNYNRAFDLIRKATSAIDVRRNTCSGVEPSIWCDTYIEWARVQYPARSRIPVDSWWFNTGYANEFLGAAGEAFRTREATWDDANRALLAWQQELRDRQAEQPVSLTYSDINEHVVTAMRAAKGDQGWSHLARTLDFAKSTLGTISDADKTGFVGAYNDAGAALLQLGEKLADPKLISEAIEFLAKAMEKASLDDNRVGWLRIRKNLSSALAALGKRTGNVQALKEALEGYEVMLKVAHIVQEKEWRTGAEEAIRDIRADLDQSSPR
jgi:tetratricopeptide (TPR) repeat protein